MNWDIFAETRIRIAHLNHFTSCRDSIAIAVKCTCSLIMFVLHLIHGSFNEVCSNLFCNLFTQLGLGDTFLVVVAFTLGRRLSRNSAGSWLRGWLWGSYGCGNGSNYRFRSNYWCSNRGLLGHRGGLRHDSCLRNLRHRSNLGNCLRWCNANWSITLWDLTCVTVLS